MPILLGYESSAVRNRDLAIEPRQVPDMAQLATLVRPILVPMQ